MDTAKPVCLLSSTSTAKQCSSKVLTDQGILIGLGAFRLRVGDSHFHTCLCMFQASGRHSQTPAVLCILGPLPLGTELVPVAHGLTGKSLLRAAAWGQSAPDKRLQATT